MLHSHPRRTSRRSLLAASCQRAYAALPIAAIALAAVAIEARPRAQDPQAGKAPPTATATAASPLGTWQGTLLAGAQALEIALHIEARGDGFGGTLDSLTQGALGIVISDAAWDGTNLELKLNTIGATFTAKWKAGPPPVLEGTWKQGPGALPLTVRAVDKVIEPVLPRPQLPQPPFPYRVEEVAYHYVPAQGLESLRAEGSEASGAITIAGTLTLPKGDGPHPVALMITGSGPQDRDESLMGHKPFFVIADHLTRAGLAVLRVDDRGTGASTGTFRGATSQDFATDVRAGLRYLQTRDDIDGARIGLIGHSEGGIIAPMVAVADPEIVAFAVLLAPPAVNIQEIVVHQQTLITRAAGDADADIAANEAFLRAVFAAIRTSEDEADLRVAVAAAADAAWPQLTDTARQALGDAKTMAENGMGVGDPWMRYLMTVEPGDVFDKMRCPTLALFGAKDLQVDPGQNVEPLREAFSKGGLIHPTVEVLPGHNHLFQRCGTGSPSEYQQIEETFSPIALDAIADWIKANVLR